MEEETGQTRERLVERPTAEVGRRIASGIDANAPRRVGLEPPRQTETRPSLHQPVRRLHNDPSPSVPAQPPASSSTVPSLTTSPNPQTQNPPPSQRINPHGRPTTEINNPSSSSSRPQPFPYRTDEELDAISDRHLAYARIASMEERMWLGGGGVEVGASGRGSGRGRGRGRGTPRSVVEGLRRTTFEELLEESRVTGRELERSCGICLEEYGLRDETITSPCDHFWHRRCFEGWLRTSQNCPLCRRNVVELARTNGPPPYSIAAPTSRSSTRGCSIQ
ncbi:hypothetical protein BDY24DRAFT_104941 [Mrakia frigida]|uniref:RING finger protein n=1 Tax=Mrakia frigida TaxID=29902 RepID=UPI003FCC1ED5